MGEKNLVKAVPDAVVKCRDQVHPWQVEDSEGCPMARFTSKQVAEGYVALAGLLNRMEDRLVNGVTYGLGDDLHKMITEGKALLTVQHEI